MDKHYIVFQNINGSNQKWCSSEPMDGEAKNFTNWISQNRFNILSPLEVQNTVNNTKNILSNTVVEKPTLYLFEFEKPSDSKTIMGTEQISIKDGPLDLNLANSK
ncbi:hypothetical protein [Bacillus sp. UNC438CL73TsuS30]|uniref:hypothetical protein n=1 Tax=Bacillus sp. UNC438CL73TsuS30 TaxID=1340434 RepID=UPI000478C301|nr:hypothetical protein [Bacillus sp. UNC438CL73TsuS30]